MDRMNIVVLLLASFGVCLAGPLNLVKTDLHNAPSVIVPNSNSPAKETEMSLSAVQTTKLPTVTATPLPAVAIKIPVKDTPIKVQTSELPARISSNVNQAVTPQTLPASVRTGVSYKSVVTADVKKNNNNNMGLHVGTQPAHVPAALSSQTNLKPNVNSKPAIHTPVMLPAQTTPNNNKGSSNAPQNVKPAIHTPVTLPAQATPNINKGSSNTPQNVKPAIHTPVTLPAQATPNNNKGSSNAPQNVKPAIHTPVTLPAHVAPNNNNHKGSSNAPQNVKPAIHTPVTLPAQATPNNPANLATNSKPAQHTPATLPAQITPNNNIGSVSAPQNVKPAIHTPVTLPAQVTPNKPVNLATNSNPAVGVPASVTLNNKDQLSATVKPAIHNPVTLLPHLNPDKKTKTPSSGETGHQASASIEHAPSRFSDSSRPTINSNIGVGAIRNKRQYAQTLPARIPAGFNNGGYHGVRPLPAVVRPAGIRGSPVYYQQPFAARF